MRRSKQKRAVRIKRSRGVPHASCDERSPNIEMRGSDHPTHLHKCTRKEEP